MSSERSVKDVFGPYKVLLERAMGIEPTSEAWEASILPLYDARSVATSRLYMRPSSAGSFHPFRISYFKLGIARTTVHSSPLRSPHAPLPSLDLCRIRAARAAAATNPSTDRAQLSTPPAAADPRP